jgi:type IV pilus assembly protein PilY1
MFYLRKSTLFALSLMLGTFMVPTGVRADDIDIFLGSSAGSADAPNIIFLIDNSPNWSRASQKWPDNGGNQGQAELTAVSSTLSRINSTRPANVGLAMLTAYSGTGTGGATPGTGGGYIRFGVRDMTNATNRSALQNILTGISNNITDPAEKVAGMANKDEDAGFYEVYKYLSGLAPYTGLYGSSYANQNVFVDVAGNPQSLSGAGEGLTSGFALNGGLYQSPITSTKPCATTYIIYIANNANNSGSIGQAAYESTVANVSPALTATPSLDTWTDEWTNFLRTNGVVVPAGNNNGAVVTYVLDAFNAEQNVGYSSSLQNAALMGGGKYYQVGSQTDIANALGMIFSEIQAVNSTFASASLPVSTTNRTQNKNQVFIPMFRPDPADRPLWMGNLKQYQVINLLGSIDLGDNSSPPIDAVNHQTGFLTPCAQSFWTTDSGTYWKSDVFDSPAPKGICGFAVTGFSSWSDDPDGPLVEKGGVAEVIRKGNNPPATNTAPTWAVNRTVYTLSGLTGTTLTPFTSTSLGISAADVSLANFILGHDVNDENANHNTTEVRPSLHGDVIHSRPQAIDYGGTTGVTVYYGSNDGTLRAVDTGSGAERWAFIAPEFYTPAPALPPATPSGFSRLMNDNPLISYPGIQSGLTPTPVPKDYYFDGSIGLYQAANNSSVWIYPSMRRGGRTIYAFDVTNPASPQVKWKAGCPYPQGNNTGCTVGMSGIGQTWSTPAVAASVVGYSRPVVIVGGGYDTCEDANTATPSCASPNGAGVYVLDANTGAVIQSFSTIRSVAADVALVAMATAGVVDHAWVVDTGGNIYRLDFVGPSSTNWVMNKVAYTTGAGRKFLFAPALATVSGHVYVALGSGDREHPLQSQYPYNAVVNRFYVYVDDLATTNATNLDDTTVMDDFTLGASGQLGTTTSCSTQGVLPTSSMKGWFINLNQYGQGEQTVTSPIIAQGAVAFSTNRPIPATQGTCSTSLGQALGYWVDLFNASGAIGVPGATCGGGRASVFTGGGLPPSPVLATVVVGGQSLTLAISTANLGGSSGNSSPTGFSGNSNGTQSGVMIAPTDPNSCSTCLQNLKLGIVPARKKIFWKSSGEN